MANAQESVLPVLDPGRKHRLDQSRIRKAEHRDRLESIQKDGSVLRTQSSVLGICVYIHSQECRQIDALIRNAPSSYVLHNG